MLRILRYLLLGLVIVVVITVAGAGWYTTTDSFRAWLRTELVARLNAGWRGELALGRIDGSIFGDLALHDVVLRHAGKTVIAAPEVRLSYSLMPFLQGRVEVNRIDVRNPVLDLEQDSAGNWNVLDALASREVAPPPPPEERGGGLAIALESVRLVDARLRVQPAGSAPYLLNELDLDSSIDLLPEGILARVRNLALVLEAPGQPKAWVSSSLSYRGVGKPDVLRLQRIAVATEDSKLELSGEARGLTGGIANLSVGARLDIKPGGAADLSRFIATWPAGEDLTGKVEVSGPASDLGVRTELAAAGARVQADVHGDLSREKPAYRAALEVANLELAKFVAGAAGVVDARANARGEGTALDGVQGDAHVAGRDLAYGEWHVGQVKLDATAAAKHARLDGELRAPSGVARLGGDLTLAQVPGYDVKLTVEHLNLAKVPAAGAKTTTDLNVSATARGEGTDPARMSATLAVAVDPSRVGEITIQKGRLDSAVRDGRVHLSELSLSANGATVRGSGELGTTADARGRIRYTVQAPDLRPWLALAGRNGSGKLSVDGTAEGNVGDLAARGRLELTSLCVDGQGVRSGTLGFALAGIGAAPLPRGTVDVAIRQSTIGARLATFDGHAEIAGTKSERIRLALDARENDQRSHSLRLEASLRAGEVTADVSRLSLQLPDGAWQLAQPARIVAGSTAVSIERFRLVNAAKTVRLEGRVGTSGRQRFEAAIERFPLEALKSFLPPSVNVRGLLGTRVEIGGTAVAPTISMRGGIDGLIVNDQPYEQLATELGYRDRSATLAFDFRQDATHSLRADGRVPLGLSWDGGFRSEVAGDMDLRVRSGGLSLAFVNALASKTVQNARGELAIDLTVSGPVDRPVPRGTVALRGGEAFLVPLNVRVEAITVEGAIEPGRVRVPVISAKSGEGTLSGRLDVALAGYVPQSVDAAISARKWPAAQTHRYLAWISGDVSARGPVAAPAVTGRVEVVGGVLKPDLEFLGKQVTPRDGTIHLVSTAAKAPPLPPPPADPCRPELARPAENAAAAAPAGAAPDPVIDVTLVIDRNTWIRHPNATIELEGEVRALKKPGSDLSLVGEVRTVRGWAVFQGRRFQVARGKVTFTGGRQIDPALDVVAEYKTGDYRVDAIVGGVASKPSLRLESDPQLEQADVLAVLLFGKPANQLNQGQQQTLGQQAVEISTTYAASQIADSVAQALGLENLGIIVEEASMERVKVGKYVGDKTFVSVSQNIAGKQGQQVAVEYEFLPDWSIVTSTNSTGENAGDVIWQKNY
ncbi:MAG: translocation and assembly module TamB [Candidatus Binatota bacterium]|nr:translocation and assembly module TamB [Candidatus Binatota bacterium]